MLNLTVHIPYESVLWADVIWCLKVGGGRYVTITDVMFYFRGCYEKFDSYIICVPPSNSLESHTRKWLSIDKWCQ